MVTLRKGRRLEEQMEREQAESRGQCQRGEPLFSAEAVKAFVKSNLWDSL